jgi:chromatin remodeling complex protein RSC6
MALRSRILFTADATSQAIQIQFKDKVNDSVQRFLSKVEKRRPVGDNTLGNASTQLITSLHRASGWYTKELDKVIRREAKDAKKVKREGREVNQALLRKYNLSPALSYLVGSPTASRADVIKSVWKYVNESNLKDESRPGRIHLDAKMKGVFGEDKTEIGHMDIMRGISPHITTPAEE